MSARPVLLLLVLCAVAGAPSAASAQGISGAGSYGVAVAASPDRVLATWVQSARDGWRIRARLLTPGARPDGPARTIGRSGPGFGALERPAVVWNPRRREFVVAFQATGPRELSESCPSLSPYFLPPAACRQADVEIYTRRLDRRGRPRGPVRRASRTGPRSDLDRTALQPRLAYDARSGVVALAYSAAVSTTPRRRVLRVRRLDRLARPVGRRRDLGGGGAPADAWGRIAPRAGGGWIAVYDRLRNDGGAPARDMLRVRLSAQLKPLGAPGRLEPTGDPFPRVVALATNDRTSRSLALWERLSLERDRGYNARLLDRAGRPAAAEYRLPFSAAWGTDVALTPHGRGWAALFTRYESGGQQDVSLLRLTASGHAAGRRTRLTHYARQPGTHSTGNDRAVEFPAIASVRGHLILVWVERHEDGYSEVVAHARTS